MRLTVIIEAVAQNTHRPLLSLTVADLGTEESRLEEELTKWFRLAAEWGAVLLIDEADVFLEKRRTSDLKRNSLVSRKCSIFPLVQPSPSFLCHFIQ